jgi:CBS domain-containing protein
VRSKFANTEHVDVGPDYSDAQLAETFLHHRVLIIPVIEDRRVAGIVTRTDFFQALAKRFLER